MVTNRITVSTVCLCLGGLAAIAVVSAQSPSENREAQTKAKAAMPEAHAEANREKASEADVDVKPSAPPARVPGAVAQSKACLECHEEIGELLRGDKHIADDFHCVVCHGPSKAHVELKVEGTLPDRVWRRWIEDENRFQWRRNNASLEIAKYCGSCHARKGVDRAETKRINWGKYLDTGHGLGVSEGNHDAATCTDCHNAHGAGREGWTDKLIVERCTICHADPQLAQRNGLDPNVVKDFRSGKHGDMPSAPAEKKASCLPCHKPH